LPRRTRTRSARKLAAWDAVERREKYARLLWELRRAWRERKEVEAAAEEVSVAGADDPESCA
jgi:hypothetical protein